MSYVSGTVLSLLVRRSLLNKYLLACSVDLRVRCRPVLCGGPSTDVSPFNIDAYWLMDAHSVLVCALPCGVSVSRGSPGSGGSRVDC